MTKILSIGDVHGRPYWKIPILGYEATTNTGSKTKIDDFDKVIFDGDYLDSFDISNIEMKHNLHEIIELKNKYPEKVELLYGNHELHYLFGPKDFQCSGFRPEIQWDFADLLRNNRDLFKLAYQYKNYLWTHAGVHRGWLKYRFQKWMDDFDKEIDDDNMNAIDGIEKREKPANLAEYLNEAFIRKESSLFDVCFLRGGMAKVGGPLWLDKRSSWDKPAKGYHQIVGHTPCKKIMTNKLGEDTSITFIDVQTDLIDEFYIIEIND